MNRLTCSDARLARALILAVATAHIVSGCSPATTAGALPAPPLTEIVLPRMDYLPGTVLGSVYWPEDDDCNGNGIYDSTEVRLGWTDDADGNLIPDQCDVEDHPHAMMYVDGIVAAAARANSAVLACSFEHHSGYTIAVYVPRGTSRARLFVRGADGKTVATIRDCLGAGKHRLAWPLRGDDGFEPPRGKPYYLELHIGRRVLRKTIAWNRPIYTDP